ncbi:MAG: nucleoside monophosphate kinase [Patescibacteria group bacterium]|nr:nucleoside monophosphate kinase [Patescibacteria group bacterium]
MFNKIIILGPQGSGKGTQAEFLAAKLNLPNISTGSIFRSEVDAKTPLGLAIAERMKNGILVDDEVINKLMAERLARPDCAHGFVLDGYPRTLLQAEFLETVAAPDCVLEINISDETAKKRLGGRLTCPQCGKIYHPEYKPARVAGQCDVCAVALITRADDEPEAIQRRLKRYHEEVAALLKYYEAKGILIKIDGTPAIPVVKEEIFNKLGL